MLLKSLPDERYNGPFVLRHPRDYCLLLLRAYELELSCDPVSVLVETLYLLDVCRINLVKLNS